MKKILIPTDFSENAKHALAYAIKLESDSEVAFHIFHTVPQVFVETPNGVMLNAILMQEMKATAIKKMNKFREFASSLLLNKNQTSHSLKTIVEIGEPIYSIVDKAKDIAADLIIMGTQGEDHNLLDKVIGTISKTVINKAPCPTILVPKSYEYKTIENILFASKFEESDPYNLYKAIKVLEPLNPTVKCLHVSKSEVEAIKHEQLANYMIQTAPSCHTEIQVAVGDKAEEIITGAAKKNNADMIVMHCSKLNALQKLIKGNLPNKVLDLLSIPLMIINK